MNSTDPFALLPFSDPVFYILLSLTAGDQDGFSLLNSVENLSGGSLRPGATALYAALSRLVRQRWVERGSLAADAALDDGEPAFLYRLTSSGRRAVETELNCLAQAARAGRQEVKHG